MVKVRKDEKMAANEKRTNEKPRPIALTLRAPDDSVSTVRGSRLTVLGDVLGRSDDHRIWEPVLWYSDGSAETWQRDATSSSNRWVRPPCTLEEYRRAPSSYLMVRDWSDLRGVA